MGHPIPACHHSITPHLIIDGAADAIEFYKKAFGAVELGRMPMPRADGSMMIGHAAIKIGDSQVFLADEFPDYGALGPKNGSPVVIHLYVEDVDAVFAQAIEAGATVTMPVENMFWGDRYGKLVDPFGHHWSIAEHLEDLTHEQMAERMAAMAGAGCE